MIASQPPEVQPNRCHVCGSQVKSDSSDQHGDAPCRRCGYLLWFTWEDLGDIDVIRPIEDLLSRDSLDHFLDSVAHQAGDSSDPRSQRRSFHRQCRPGSTGRPQEEGPKRRRAIYDPACLS